MHSKTVISLLWDEVAHNHRRVEIKADGYSMSPLIEAGDQISVEPCDLTLLKPGDIILFHLGETYVFHRLHRIKRLGADPASWEFTAQGDANFSADPPVKGSDIIGCVGIVLSAKFRIAPWRLLNFITTFALVKLGKYSSFVKRCSRRSLSAAGKRILLRKRR